MRPFSENELKHRRPVWEALSDLFLDTDTKELENEIAKKLAQSPYDIAAIEKIIMNEVKPVLIWNIFAWEWMCFDPGWLEERILRKRRSPLRYIYKFICPIMWLDFPSTKQRQRVYREVNRLRKC